MERRIALFAVACVVALCAARQGLAGQAGGLGTILVPLAFPSHPHIRGHTFG